MLPWQKGRTQIIKHDGSLQPSWQDEEIKQTRVTGGEEIIHLQHVDEDLKKRDIYVGLKSTLNLCLRHGAGGVLSLELNLRQSITNTGRNETGNSGNVQRHIEMS